MLQAARINLALQQKYTNMNAIRLTLFCLFLTTYANAQKVGISPVFSLGCGKMSYFNADGEKVKNNSNRLYGDNDYDPYNNVVKGLGLRFSFELTPWLNILAQTGSQYYKGEVDIYDMRLNGISDGNVSVTPDFDLYVGNVNYEQHLMYVAILPEFVLVKARKLYVNVGLGLNIPVVDHFTSTGRPDYASVLVSTEGDNPDYELSDFDTERSHPYQVMLNIGTQIGKGRLRFLGEFGYTYLPAKKILDPGSYTDEYHYLPIVAVNLFQLTAGISYDLN